jgi:hypothetical protein
VTTDKATVKAAELAEAKATLEIKEAEEAMEKEG